MVNLVRGDEDARGGLPWSLDRLLARREDLATSLSQLLSHGSADSAQEMLNQLLVVEEQIRQHSPDSFWALLSQWTQTEAELLHSPGDPRIAGVCTLCDRHAKGTSGTSAR